MATQPVVDLGGTPFLDRMPRDSRQRILVNSSSIRYAAGTIPFQPGSSDRADILETGLVRLFLTSSDGRQTTIRYVHPGELMGGLLVMGAACDAWSIPAIVASRSSIPSAWRPWPCRAYSESGGVVADLSPG